MSGGNIKIRGLVRVPPIIDMTKSKLGTDSAITIASTDNVLRTIHLLGLKSENKDWNSFTMNMETVFNKN